MQRGERTSHENDAILTRERALVLLLLAATAMAIYLCYRLLVPFLPALSWALALAIVVHPVHRWLSHRIGNRDLCAGLTLVIVMIGLVAPAMFVTYNLVGQATQNAVQIEEATLGGQLQAAIERNPRLAPMLAWLQQHVDLAGELRNAFSSLAQGASSLVTGSVLAVLQLLFTLFALFFFLRDYRQALFSIRSLLPLSDDETDRMFARVTDTIYGTIYGTVTVSMLQGALGGTMFWFLGLPAPLLWALVMGLLAIVPYLGTFIIWGPAAVWLFMQGETGKALILTAWGMLVVGLVDNLVYPLLVGKRLRMHPLLALVAIIGGLSLFGSSGLVLGPIVVAVTQGLVRVWQERSAAHRGVEQGIDDGSPADHASPRPAVLSTSKR
jgi:predicted PurR-regulated permease PerM